MSRFLLCGHHGTIDRSVAVHIKGCVESKGDDDMVSSNILAVVVVWSLPFNAHIKIIIISVLIEWIIEEGWP